MSFLKKIFSNKNKRIENPIDLSVLKTDIHSHLIPAVDDGSKSMEDSIAMIRRFAEMGYKKIVTTPHIMSDFYRNTPEILLPKLEEVRAEIKKQGIPIQLDLAAEYYLDFQLEQKIETEKLLTFGEKYLLFELSYVNPPDNLDGAIFKMLTHNYKPILAHPERYPFWENKFEKYQDIKDKGALLQLNINSLTGYYSPGTKKLAIKMIDAGLVDFVGTDCHRLDHLDLMQDALRSPHLLKLIESGKLLNSTL